MVAPIVNLTGFASSPLSRTLDWSVTSASHGSSESRSSTCATRIWESAEPVMVKPVGTPGVAAVGVAAAEP